MRVVEQLRKDVKEAKDRENKLRCPLASRDSEKVSGAEKLREYEVAFDAMAQREAAMKSKVADMRKQVAGEMMQNGMAILKARNKILKRMHPAIYGIVEDLANYNPTRKYLPNTTVKIPILLLRWAQKDINSHLKFTDGRSIFMALETLIRGNMTADQFTWHGRSDLPDVVWHNDKYNEGSSAPLC